MDPKIPKISSEKKVKVLIWRIILIERIWLILVQFENGYNSSKIVKIKSQKWWKLAESHVDLSQVRKTSNSLPFLSRVFSKSKNNSLFSWKWRRYNRLCFFHEKIINQPQNQPTSCLISRVLPLRRNLFLWRYRKKCSISVIIFDQYNWVWTAQHYCHG